MTSGMCKSVRREPADRRGGADGEADKRERLGRSGDTARASAHRTAMKPTP